MLLFELVLSLIVNLACLTAHGRFALGDGLLYIVRDCRVVEFGLDVVVLRILLIPWRPSSHLRAGRTMGCACARALAAWVRLSGSRSASVPSRVSRVVPGIRSLLDVELVWHGRVFWQKHWVSLLMVIIGRHIVQFLVLGLSVELLLNLGSSEFKAAWILHSFII